MADCNVCLGGYDGDPPRFYTETYVMARKPHVCDECKRPITKGDTYERIVGKWYDEVETYRFCLDCSDIGKSLSCDGTREFGTLWQNLQDYVFPEMNFACVGKLSTASAKAFLVSRYNEWSRAR